jgi:hypothetical protein
MATLDFPLPIVTPTIPQAIAMSPIPEIQAPSNLNLVPEQPTLVASQLSGLAISARDLPSIDDLLNPDLSTAELPTIDTNPSQPDPVPLPALGPASLEYWSLDLPSVSFPDPTATGLESSWIEFTDWLEPHIWSPAPTYLMPAPMFGFPILREEYTGENKELSDTLPTAMPESMLGPTSLGVVKAGSVVDRSYDWAFFDSGDVTVEGEVLSPMDGRLTRWLPGDTTYVGLFNDGLLIGSYLVPYPKEYRQWMQEHNIVVWK